MLKKHLVLKNPHASLLHIEMTVKEQHVIAMVDTRATQMFVDVKIATKLGLKLSKNPSYVKIVNAKAQAIVGMAYGVSISTESLVGKHNLMVMPLGEFDIILGIDFLRKFQFVPFPHLDGVMVMNGSKLDFLKDFIYLVTLKLQRRKTRECSCLLCQSTKG